MYSIWYPNSSIQHMQTPEDAETLWIRFTWLESYQQPTGWRLKLCICQFSANPHAVTEQREPTSCILSSIYLICYVDLTHWLLERLCLLNVSWHSWSVVFYSISWLCLLIRLQIADSQYKRLFNFYWQNESCCYINDLEVNTFFFIEDLHILPGNWAYLFSVNNRNREKLFALLHIICPQESG